MDGGNPSTPFRRGRNIIMFPSACGYEFIYLCMCVCAIMGACTSVDVFTCGCMWVWVWVHVCLCLCMCVCVRVCVHMHTHTCVHPPSSVQKTDDPSSVTCVVGSDLSSD
eukprot:GHVU01072023.1.p3 GENE.GHVU01072023.1~~GHVU01072023.1.p3  ORF type:complete len:109 (+),score=6.65 GHVU01072023.1:544-870(+)